MVTPKRLAACLLLLPACFSRGGMPVSGYADDLTPQPILEAASPLATTWTSSGMGSSSYISGSSFTSVRSYNGTFECPPDKLDELANSIKDAFEEDVFSKGFQLAEDSEVELGSSTGSAYLATVAIHFEDQVEKGTARIELVSGAKAGEYEYELTVEEESR